ncbi:unnamed protein product [Amoebophrya sp. A120]|nr:unnamed protein product [Amoebophrya sp. A120]|eukprot:GSA120T00010868001.1
MAAVPGADAFPGVPPEHKESIEEITLHQQIRTLEIDSALLQMQNQLRSQRLLLEEWAEFAKTEEEKTAYQAAQEQYDAMVKQLDRLENRNKPE